MGHDDLFHKRKALAVQALKRKRREIAQAERYLIVCEGEATEPHYFNGLKNVERLPTAHVEVWGEQCGSDPLSVVEFAATQYAEETLDRYDRVFCVIDRDRHDTFKPAVARVKELLESGVPIELVVSWPCFEFWILLHYRYTRNPYGPTRKLSPCDAVGAEIKRDHDKAHLKARPDIYPVLRPRQEFAIANAKTACKDVLATGMENPSTQVHTLVETLLALKRFGRS